MGSIFANGETRPLFSELHGAPLPAKLPFMLDRLNENSERHAEKLAVISYHQRNDLYEDILGQLPESAISQHLRWPFSRLQALTRRLAAALMVMGVTKGTPIATFIDNSVEWPMCFWACLQLGCPIVPLNPRGLSNHEEISHMLRVSGAKVLFVRDHQLARKIDTELSDISQAMTLKIAIDSDRSDFVLSSTWISLTGLLAASDPQNMRSPPAFDYCLSLSTPRAQPLSPRAVRTRTATSQSSPTRTGPEPIRTTHASPSPSCQTTTSWECWRVS
jgi:acyl-CoA synthetase (AMP-forming)/AMP-acid ligase II